MLNFDYEGVNHLETVLDKTAENQLAYDSDTNWYHSCHVWKEFENYLDYELSHYSKESLDYHLSLYYEGNKVSKVILIYYRDMYMSFKDKLKLPIELLVAK